jgi:hypothetical protein
MAAALTGVVAVLRVAGVHVDVVDPGRIAAEVAQQLFEFEGHAPIAGHLADEVGGVLAVDDETDEADAVAQVGAQGHEADGRPAGGREARRLWAGLGRRRGR